MKFFILLSLWTDYFVPSSLEGVCRDVELSHSTADHIVGHTHHHSHSHSEPFVLLLFHDLPLSFIYYYAAYIL